MQPAFDIFHLPVVDLYRDVHKGIRAELFAVTSNAGRIDPGLDVDRLAIADHVQSLYEFLELHAHHEDRIIDPVLEVYDPALAEQITTDHVAFEARFGGLVELAREAVDARARHRRRLTHRLHLELSSFTSAYLAHQFVEERMVMPALEQAIGPDAVRALEEAIVGAISPDEMARTLAIMLPAMNVDDRTEMLTGIRMGAPPEVFAGVVDLARSVLTPTDMAALEHRLAT
jgi:iron-sulfur cluster repair protein YtfE (RIC family)